MVSVPQSAIMEAARSPQTLLLVLVATAAAGGSTVRAACVAPPPDARQVTTGAGQVWWACRNASATWPNLLRVVRSGCENGFMEEEMECEVPDDVNATLPCTNETLEVENAEKEELIPGVAFVYTCMTGHAWLSWEEEKVSQCYKGEWTPIQDMCEPECSMPRDCAEVQALGHNTSGRFDIHPSGDRHEAPLRVQCKLSNNTAESGWLLAAYTEPSKYDNSVDTADVMNGFGEYSNPPFFVGAKNLVNMNWNDDTPRPLVYRFTVKLTDEEQVQYTTYTHVQVASAAPWNLTLGAPYHGDAGDIFSSEFTDSVWGDGEQFMSLLRKPSPTWLGHSLERMKLHVRPTSYDQATSCPSLVGVSSTWRHTWAEIPKSRAPGTRIKYRCEGPLRVHREEADERTKTENTTQDSSPTMRNSNMLEDLGYSIVSSLLPPEGETGAWTAGNATGDDNETKAEDSWSKEGFVECMRSGAEEFVWSASLELPCLLTCPDNYTKSEDELSCIRIHHSGADFGITSASLRCHEDGASLAPADRVPINSSLLLPDHYYYTASIWRNGEWMPETSLPCADGEQCNGDERRACYSIKATPEGALEGKEQSCVQNDTGFVCTWPAWCPGDYQEYQGLCLKVTEDFANISEAKPDYQKGMLDCMTEGASLAYPESLGALTFLERLVREKESNRTGQPYESDLDEDKRVITGLYDSQGDWTGGGVYSPDPALLQLAGEDPEKSYRLLTVPRTMGQNLTLTLTDVSIRHVAVHYVACQLYGLTDCPGELPQEGANMTLLSANISTRYYTSLGYRCYPGHFSHGDVAWNEQWARCYGSMGGWMYPSRPEMKPFVDCIYMEVCNDTTVMDTLGFTPNITLSSDHRYLCGTINITCPPHTTTPNKTSDQLLTCSESDGAFDYLPQALPCNVCKGKPYSWGADFEWNENQTYITDDRINATCKEDYLTRRREDEVVIMCGEWGWWPTDVCFKVCYEPPPPPGANITLERAPNGTVVMGETALYRCSPGTYIPQSFPDVKSSLTLKCAHGKWKPNLQEDPNCAILCLADPPSSPPIQTHFAAPVITSWDGITRTAGTQVDLWCPEDRVLPDLMTNVTVVCGTDGTWTPVEFDHLICRRVAVDPPPLPPGSAMEEGQAPPNYWEGDEVRYRCPHDMMTPAGTNTTVAHFNGLHWALEDPAFECLRMCFMDPPMPPSLANSTWDGWTRFAYTQVELTCPDPYLFANLNNSISITCHNETLTWTYVDPEVLRCRILALEPPPLPPGSEREGPAPPNYWEGDVVEYRCPIDKLSPTSTNTTTAFFNGSDWTLDEPTFECLPVCWRNPPTPQGPGNSTWDGWTRFVNISVELTCPAPYLFANLNTSITITCHPQTLNWTFEDAEDPCLSNPANPANMTCARHDSSSDDPNFLHCRILALEPPPLPPGSEREGPAPPNYWEGDVVEYRCPPNKLSPTGTNTTTAYFNGSDWTLDDPTFECLPVCWRNPPTPQGPGNSTWDGWTRFVNISVELTCPAPYLFANLNTSITITCHPQTLNWTFEDAEDPCLSDPANPANMTCARHDSSSDDPNFLHCRILAVEDPPLPHESEIMGQAPPHYWEGDVVMYRCPSDKLSPTGTNTTTAHFNGTDWVLDDPTFECLPMCSGPPPAPHADMEWTYGGGEVWGAVATYTCHTHFPDGNTTLNTTCSEGNWTLTELPHCAGVAGGGTAELSLM